ncbi:MAG: ExeM/NucH family extracellular endonuclease [Xanthomonadales bacterium]|nr:ExeM/NucH family extracellular endonuclease [Xanthomonadales bacterium]
MLNRCPESTTLIANVQGNSYKSPLSGQQVSVKGIVTLIQNGEGLYIEEPGSNGNRTASNAIFIQSGKFSDEIEPGSLITVHGTVTEIGNDRDPQTALTNIDEPVLCSSGNALSLSGVSLPLDEASREALEGMRVSVNDTLVVTDVYQFDQGKFTLSGNGLQYVATEIDKPGPATTRHIAENRASALPVLLPEGMGFPTLLVNGDSTDQLIGVMAHDDRGKRLTLQSISTFSSRDFPAPEPISQGSLRVVGMNLHNYFNGDGNGKGFPTPRGAETMEAFQQQRDRIGAAIEVLDPHVIAVMELENDGFGPASAAQDFIQLSDNATLSNWSVTRPENDNTGTDKITVGMFYRTDRLKAVGPSETLGGPEFKRSRQPQAQLFQQLPGEETLLVVINHLKSKGSCPDSGENANQKDGQGCWNPMRKAAAEKMSAWAKELAASKGTDNILILGDMNAYRNEDPVGAIRDAGFTELMEKNQLPEYSFIYAGQRGTLDYAFTSDALLEHAQAHIWHVNAAFPAHMESPKPWLRFSDHDPVVVDIRWRQSSTSD